MRLQGHATECEENYGGSSPAMEVFAADIQQNQSIEYNFRYIFVVSDGDAKVYSHLKELKVYGANIHIEKEQFINHLYKILRTALRNPVEDTK